MTRAMVATLVLAIICNIMLTLKLRDVKEEKEYYESALKNQFIREHVIEKLLRDNKPCAPEVPAPFYDNLKERI